MVLPSSYYILKLIFMFLTTSFVRFAYSFFENIKELFNNRKRTINTMIIGAGYSGVKIIHEIYRDEKSKYKVCCLIDDDKSKIKSYVKNIPVVGDVSTIKQNAENVAKGLDAVHTENTSILSYNNENSLSCVIEKYHSP